MYLKTVLIYRTNYDYLNENRPCKRHVSFYNLFHILIFIYFIQFTVHKFNYIYVPHKRLKLSTPEISGTTHAAVLFSLFLVDRVSKISSVFQKRSVYIFFSKLQFF